MKLTATFLSFDRTMYLILSAISLSRNSAGFFNPSARLIVQGYEVLPPGSFEKEDFLFWHEASNMSKAEQRIKSFPILFRLC